MRARLFDALRDHDHDEAGSDPNLLRLTAIAKRRALQQVVLQGRMAAMNGFGQMRDTRTGEVPIVFRTDANSRRLTQP